jgi:hypothetical protein
VSHERTHIMAHGWSALEDRPNLACSAGGPGFGIEERQSGAGEHVVLQLAEAARADRRGTW